MTLVAGAGDFGIRSLVERAEIAADRSEQAAEQAGSDAGGAIAAQLQKKLDLAGLAADFATATASAITFDGSIWRRMAGSKTANGGTVIAGPNGFYYQRDIPGKKVLGEWFGMIGDGADESARMVAALNAVPDGGTLQLPKATSYYDFRSISLTSKAVAIDGAGSTIRQTTSFSVFDYAGSWGTTNNVSSISLAMMSVNTSTYSTRRTVKLTLSAAPQQLAVDDIVKVYSENDIPQSRFAGRKLGEFAKVAKITGNDVYLQADLRDRTLYTTSVKIARLNRYSLTIENLNFEKAPTLNVAGSSVGADSYIRISSAYKPVLRNVTIKNSISNAVVFWSCYSYLADNVNAEDLPDNQDNSNFGYAIVDAQSEYGIVQNCTWTNVRHGFTTNTYAAGQTTPNAYGRSAYFTVANCQCVGGLYSGFDCHDEAYMGSFRGCRHVGANYRDLAGTVSTPCGFNNRGSRMRFEACEAVNCDIGFVTLSSASERIGGGNKANWATGNQYVNCSGYNLTRSAFVFSQAPASTIVGGCFEDSPTGIAEDLVSITQSDVTISGQPTFKHYAPGDASIGVFGLTNADLKVGGMIVDVSYAHLNEAGQCVNYNNSLVVIRANGTAGQQIALKNVEVNTGDRPINALVSNVSGQTTNSIVRVDTLSLTRNSGSITCSDSVSRLRGGLAVGNGLSSIATGNGWIRDFYQQNPGSIFTTATFAYSTRSSSTASPTTTDPAPWMQYRGDFRFTIDITPTANISLGSFPFGYYRGQIMTLRHNGTTNTITITNGSGRTIPGGASIALSAGETTDFLWDGATWKNM